ncbi:MAG: hypothetical protein WAL29_03290 [Bacteroidales bacterium]
MKLIRYKHTLLINAIIVMQVCLFTSCNTNSYNSKHQDDKIGFLGFYLDMDYSKVKSKMDSLLNLGDLYYYETTDMLGNKQKNLYSDFSEISPSLSAKVNLRGTVIIDERLTSIQLTLCSRSKKGKQRFSYSCDQNELKRLFELYKEKYGKPTLLGQGEEYDWLSKKISNVYFPGPRGRWLMDKIYYWERGNYIIYFDFGYPENLTGSDSPVMESPDPDLPDSTSAPIIYYDFTPEYIDKLLEKASM